MLDSRFMQTSDEQRSRILQFIREGCFFLPDGRTPASHWYRSYERWSEANGYEPMSHTILGRLLRETLPSMVKRGQGAIYYLHHVPHSTFVRPTDRPKLTSFPVTAEERAQICARRIEAGVTWWKPPTESPAQRESFEKFKADLAAWEAVTPNPAYDNPFGDEDVEPTRGPTRAQAEYAREHDIPIDQAHLIELPTPATDQEPTDA